MALYQPGDLIFNEYDKEGRFVCDGSLISRDAYPLLASALEHALFDYDAPKNTLTGTPPLPGAGSSSALSPDGVFLAIVHSGAPYLTILRTSDWSVVPNTPVLTGSGSDCAYSPDGKLLLLVHQGAPCLTMIRTSDWSVIAGTPSLSGEGTCCKFSPTGALFAVGCSESPFFKVFHTSDWSEENTPIWPGIGRINDFAFSPDGEYLAFAGASTSRHLMVLRTTDWSMAYFANLTSDGLSVDFSPSGDMLAIGHKYYSNSTSPNPRHLLVLRTSNWSVVLTQAVPSSSISSKAGVYSLSFSPDEKFLTLLSEGSPYLFVYHTKDWRMVRDTPPLSGRGNGCTFSQDRTHLFVTHEGNPGMSVILSNRALVPESHIPLPIIPDNPQYPGLPVLIQADEE